MSLQKTATVEEKIVQFIELAGAGIDQAQAHEAQRTAEKQAAAAEIPAAVDALIKAEILDDTPAVRQKAASVFQDPVKVLRMLKTVAERQKQASAVTPLGTPAVKTASAIGAPRGENDPEPEHWARCAAAFGT